MKNGYSFDYMTNTLTVTKAFMRKAQEDQNSSQYKIIAKLGLSQILCKHRNAVQIEQNLFKAEVAQAAAALFSK